MQDKGGELGKRLSIVEQATFEQEAQPAANINMNFAASARGKQSNHTDSALGSNRGQSQGSMRQRSPDGLAHSPTLKRGVSGRVDNALL